MKQLKSRQGLEPRKITNRMARGLVRNSQKNPHITAKEGRMDSTKYHEILEANVQRLIRTLKLKRV